MLPGIARLAEPAPGRGPVETGRRATGGKHRVEGYRRYLVIRCAGILTCPSPPIRITLRKSKNLTRAEGDLSH